MHSSAPRARRRPPPTAARTFTRTRIPSRVLRARLTRTPRSARRANRESRSTDERPLTRHLATARAYVASIGVVEGVVARRGVRGCARRGKKIASRARGRGVRTSVVVVDGSSRARRASRSGVEARQRREGDGWLYRILCWSFTYIDVDGGHDGCHGFVLYKTMWAIL